MNEYGDTNYKAAVMIVARKQPHEEVVKDSHGKEYLSKHIIYVEPHVESNAFSIGEYHLLDGEKVVNIYKMNDLVGKTKLIRFITV